ncbi:hypothetical protein I4U23_007169 [Adineta vaga]|nr:hypothetical protein I4U23_007169 [Adineta vaga]
MSWSTKSQDNLSSKISCWFVHLPYELLQTITDFLNVKDLQALSKTCQTFYIFINNDKFWLYRLRHQFSRSIVQLYTTDLFKKPEYISTYNEIQASGFAHSRTDHILDNLAITSATHYNDEAVERRQTKMYISKEMFLMDLEFFQYNKPNDSTTVPFMKLIYFYLIDRKRCSAIDMDTGDQDAFKTFDADSLTGQIINVREVVRLDITGRFQCKIMPGKYEVSWRMKGNLNSTKMPGETEFILVPQHGKLMIYRMMDEDFQSLLLQYDNSWFLVKMGYILIYEPSTILIGIRNWNNRFWKKFLQLDCIELTIVP